MKASEVPGHRGEKHWVKFPPLATQLTNQSPVCVELAFLKSPRQTLKSISKWRQRGHELVANNWSNVQVTKWCENATAYKSNVNLLFIPDLLSKEVKESIHPASGGTSWWIWDDNNIPAFPLSCPEGVGWGFQMTGALCSDSHAIIYHNTKSLCAISFCKPQQSVLCNNFIYMWTGRKYFLQV